VLRPRGASGTPAPGDTWVWAFPGDLLRLVANPAAGGVDPIGREFHPYGRLSEGAMVYAALQALGDRYTPAEMVLHYTNAVRGDRDFTLLVRVSSAEARAVVADCTFYEGPVPVAEARLSCVAR
jgi:hypothetical protein